MSLQEKAYDLFKKGIAEETFQAGDRIFEVELAKRWKMSRTPIKRALIRLEAEGIIRKLSNSSLVVAEKRLTIEEAHYLEELLLEFYKITLQKLMVCGGEKDITSMQKYKKILQSFMNTTNLEPLLHCAYYIVCLSRNEILMKLMERICAEFCDREVVGRTRTILLKHGQIAGQCLEAIERNDLATGLKKIHCRQNEISEYLEIK
ncbi:GntR family transcriptional regulator [Listeria newyorkensis]|uniref:GntR family transcriptional regulator n=1 Tax=Listeria newyorkensis TaxID=1497681 RepID=A0A841YWE9_9LIST|nr:GntR family transcriptional regulator [Listeria newyorkensis]MBC1456937.1 GntR family transcriptional regulator [Listeria newyorkensis]